MMKEILNVGFLLFWVVVLFLVTSSRDKFDLFQWVALVLISSIGLMFANYIFDNQEKENKK